MFPTVVVQENVGNMKFPLLYPDIITLTIPMYPVYPGILTFPGSFINIDMSWKFASFVVLHVKLCMELWTGTHTLTNTCNYLLDLNTSKGFLFFPTFQTFDFEESAWFYLSLNLKLVQCLLCPLPKDMICSNKVLIKLRTETDWALLLQHLNVSRKIVNIHLVSVHCISVILC